MTPSVASDPILRTKSVSATGLGANTPGPQEKGLHPRQYLFLVAQLALLAVIIRQFQIESSAFLRIALLAFAGFVVHAVLPLRYRLPFFVLLSLAGIWVVLGITSGAWLVGLGLLLIGICHLPMSLWGRATLLLLVATGLASLRMNWFHAPWSQAIWPILGSMFMFRLIVYLYDLSHEQVPFSVWRTLAYFFLLPNVCFPLFPVVDYKNFRRNYYDTAVFQTYQVGVNWIARGVIHLILYRAVYYYMVVAPSEVTQPRDLVRYMLATFLLYLRVSGQFHIIVGILHLFGFNLPETNHRYFLASSFTDFWRRINIYWKDFMMKVFFYPCYFRLKRFGSTAALVWSTVFVFLATWLLHSYQWFWLRGNFPVTKLDIVFWSIFGILVLANSLYEVRHGRRRNLSKFDWNLRSFTPLALCTLGTFAVITVLWSLWTSTSFAEWASMWHFTGKTMKSSALWIPTLLLPGVVLGAAAQRSMCDTRSSIIGRSVSLINNSTAKTVLSLLILVLLGTPAIYSHLNANAANLILSLRSGHLSRLDTALMERGYYENLLRVDRFNSQLWEVYATRPGDWLDVQGTSLDRFTGDFLERELRPSSVSVTRYGTISTNRWGMRDQDYNLHPAPNTYRAALLGASVAFGSGVNDGQTFEAVLERRLNSDQQASRDHTRYEILNFAVPNYSPLQQLIVLKKVWAFDPDAVWYAAAGHEATGSLRYLVKCVQKRIPLPYAYLQQVVTRAGIGPNTPEAAAMRQLQPFQHEIMLWVYHQIVLQCREHGAQPVWMFVPWLGTYIGETDVIPIARDAGFLMIDLSDVYKGHDPKTLWVTEWDGHPNAAGHALIAARLEQRLQAEGTVLSYRRPDRKLPAATSDDMQRTSPRM